MNRGQENQGAGPGVMENQGAGPGVMENQGAGPGVMEHPGAGTGVKEAAVIRGRRTVAGARNRNKGENR